MSMDMVKKKLFFGKGKSDGIIGKLFVYVLLLALGFVYLYPLLFMAVNSVKDSIDLVNPTVSWVPSSLYLGNYIIAIEVLQVGKALVSSFIMAGVPAILQTASCAFIGYGFARFNFPLKNFWMVLLLAAFMIPVQVTLVPKYMLFDAYKMLNTVMPSFLPSLLGQGIKGTIFVLIFYQFFRSYPIVLDEAAEIDGAGKFQTFFRIALPMSIPAIVVAFLFSFVWYWNETYLSGMFFGKTIQTLPMRLESFVNSYSALYPGSDGSTANKLNESIRLAATLITIAPLIIIYSVLQKQFVESVDKAGITGE